ncbi:MAG: hypothetical protein EBU93_04730, partial [Chlamydiae bacterium]|nr:hypothetical protein [Chlamydiota bacterium]
KTEVVITTEQVYFCPSEGGDILYNTDPASILITLKKLLKLSPDFVKLHLKRLYLMTQDLERVRNKSIVLGLRNLSNRLFTPKISLNDLEANIDLTLKKNP